MGHQGPDAMTLQCTALHYHLISYNSVAPSSAACLPPFPSLSLFSPHTLSLSSSSSSSLSSFPSLSFTLTHYSMQDYNVQSWFDLFIWSLGTALLPSYSHHAGKEKEKHKVSFSTLDPSLHVYTCGPSAIY